MTDAFDESPQSEQGPTRQERLYYVLAAVPSGRVISYGQLAALAGLGRAARWVGRMLSHLPEGTSLPWHRVLAANGKISLPAESASAIEQRQRLIVEGVIFHNGKVDMRRYGWNPAEPSE
ncbi:methylated-DNA-protein-cysteine methyltransferase-like protein [Pseudomonas duriflava]|uniref:Methylated-DNA-protein-cysteine methyltransferase-like protein n=1 Tax=Pseudomonas duriflava TaxID=459528 RepID=A0A562QP36_9PSED|nr:MGMT family protein [Pseudomonas duriflava]TWI58494.1 methylated-DNA-protein-cysteine methyltransferase-like protein [Pseudomonas duriflava]